jgi:hypothetical protein
MISSGNPPGHIPGVHAPGTLSPAPPPWAIEQERHQAANSPPLSIAYLPPLVSNAERQLGRIRTHLLLLRR